MIIGGNACQEEVIDFSTAASLTQLPGTQALLSCRCLVPNHFNAMGSMGLISARYLSKGMRRD